MAANAALDPLHNDSRAALNFCVAYTSRDEIATAVNDTIRVSLLEGRTELALHVCGVVFMLINHVEKSLKGILKIAW